ncbi:ATP-dependent nuclease [Tardiphaga sp. 42S5]|uniref:ATP-dependent nuclease n=1 Tax=Tardiphaga sp. 42S5 TaxID=1404799 RepID=UPI002A5A4C8D|nr:AAA family ATPase [Tardiphaga sp. 42S5]WPO43646.1 AAA family ATPase [Tardiphaga sp. 42S5]
MRLLEFRIQNFRSIKDTGWCSLSSDATTVLIGQNESGKSSILSALEKTFSHTAVEDDDHRAGAPHPSVSARVLANYSELTTWLVDYPEAQMQALSEHLLSVKGHLEFSISWDPAPNGSEEKFVAKRNINDPELSAALAARWTPNERLLKSGQHITPEERSQHEETDFQSELTTELVASAVFEAAPLTVLFDEETGLLPDSIDITTKDGDHELVGEGATAASNYLALAGIDLDQLMSGDIRSRENLLNRGNKKVSSDFATFWSQTIGHSDRLHLRCDLNFHGSNEKGKAGQPYLIFWISDGQNHLYPKQRSTGVRWFLSFYLQLKAADESSLGTLFLLDEPGANLHSKAQADVLSLINKLKNDQQIIYSTHSPHMIEYDKLYRVLAVQREGLDDDTPTVVMHAHKLGGASRDTLSPLLTAMGADFSQQNVIKKRNNVILEEMSGFYYLKSFWKITGEKQEAHFIAATGANNVEALASMFIGWGLDFIIAVDDDPTGRSVFNGIKRRIFADDEILSRSRMIKISGKGIEDIFSTDDFKSLVLGEPELAYECENSHYVKENQISKTMLAYQFWLRVSAEKEKLRKMSSETQNNIATLVKEISTRLISAV